MKLSATKFVRALARHGGKALLGAALLFGALQAGAVSEAEMDHARAIAAKFYVRYINDGAGYLDNWLPSSMAELERKVSNKTDKENLKAFKAAAYPSDYASWDKARLAAYWGGEFFTANAPSLNAKAAGNAMCKKQIKKAVEGIKVEAPAPAPATAQEQPEAAPAAPQAPSEAEQAAIDATLAREAAELDEAEAQVAEENARNAEAGGDSGTWVYIMVLGILVAVVIALVIFASRTMKNQSKGRGRDVEEDAAEESAPEVAEPVRERVAPEEAAYAQPAAAVADETRMREKYARTLASKSEEIRTLTRQLADMEALAARLKEDNRKLSAEVERLRNSAYQPQPQQPQRTRHHHDGAHHEGQRHHEGHDGHASAAPAAEAREVYLGRVNSKGLFVRADRHAVDGQSIYKLTTHNGTSGTYALINNPLIIDQVLDNPGKWLAGGCFAKDIFDTEGKENIRTETPGTAVFADGAWRVERKAKIRYE